MATCGTALTEDHVTLLKRFTRRLVLAYDADEAGQAAADRVYAWEQTHEIEVAVVALPPGTDPDELARTIPETLQAAVERRPGRSWRSGSTGCWPRRTWRTPEGRARAAEAALEVVAEHPDELVRDQYVMELADTLPHRRRPAAGPPGACIRRTAAGPRPSPSRRAAGTSRCPEDGAGSDDGLPAPAGGRRSARRSAVAIHHPDIWPLRSWSESFFAAPHGACRACDAPGRRPTRWPRRSSRPPPEVAELLARLSVETSEAEPTDVLARLATEVGRTAPGRPGGGGPGGRGPPRLRAI